jgi:trigger factor
MQTNIETLSKLERRLDMAVPAEEIDREVEQRLRRLSRTVRMDGFRPGKVPLKIVAQQYGPQVRSEVIGDAVQKAFSDVVRQQNLKVAGYPRIERKEGGDAKQLAFSATFEIYPEIKLGASSAKPGKRSQGPPAPATASPSISSGASTETSSREAGATGPPSSWAKAACCPNSSRA